MEKEQFGSAKIVTVETAGKWPEEGDEEEEGTIFATDRGLEELARNDDDERDDDYKAMEVDGAIGEEQDKDEELRKCKEMLKGKSAVKEEEVKGRGKRFKSLFEKKERMMVEDGILKWYWREDVSNIDRKVIMIPSHMEKRVIEDFHGLGHFGEEKLVSTIRQHVWMHDLRTKVQNYAMACQKCQARFGGWSHGPISFISKLTVQYY